MNPPIRESAPPVRAWAWYRNLSRGLTFVAIGVFAGGCPRSQPAAEKEEPRTEVKTPDGRVFVAMGPLLRDQGGAYDGREIETFGQFVSKLERGNDVIFRIEEPGAPPDGKTMFCLLADPTQSTPVFGQRVAVRGTKRGSALSVCTVTFDGGR